MGSQLIILDASVNPNVSELKKEFDKLWNDPMAVIVFLLGIGEGFDKIADNLDAVAANHASRRGVWIKQPDKIIPNKASALRNNDPKIVLSSVGFDRVIGSWRPFEKAVLKQEIDDAFNEATERDGAQ